MQLAPYITFKSGENLLICQTRAPHYIGLVSGNRESTFHTVQVPLHSLFVSFKGNLEGNFMLMKQDEVKNIKKVFEEMAIFYFHDRILKFPERFKKYKI